MHTDALTSLERDLMMAVAALIPERGLNGDSLKAAARQLGLNDAEVDLICPNGPMDIAALLWRSHDAALEAQLPADVLDGLKIREKISRLLNGRIDVAAADEKTALRLMGYLSLPPHLGLSKRLVWDSADLIWRKAGDKALDENHYSKRLIVSGILAAAMMTRLSQGQAAQHEQIARNIDQIMAFESFKAKLPFKPESALLGLAETLGQWRFGKAV